MLYIEIIAVYSQFHRKHIHFVGKTYRGVNSYILGYKKVT
jgi:hypothetical protein